MKEELKMVRQIRFAVPNAEERAEGALLGQAIGDAMGATNENRPYLSVPKSNFVDSIVGGGWLRLRAGDVTDDTEMAACIVEAIVNLDSPMTLDSIVDAVTMEFIGWMDNGPIDIGGTVSRALTLHKQGNKNVKEIMRESVPIANGSLMRTSPLSVLHVSREDLISLSWEISDITHPNVIAGMSCAVYNDMIHRIIFDTVPESIMEIAKDSIKFVSDVIGSDTLAKSFKSTYDDMLVGGLPGLKSWRSIDCLVASVLLMSRNTTFKSTIIEAANMGGDCDTVGAIVGALAGAYYGGKSIPQRWVDQLGFKAIDYMANGMDLFDRKIELLR